MKSTHRNIALTVAVLGLLSFWSCTRSEVEYPNPTGPSTISVILQINAAPNVIYAGETRQDVVVTANLREYDGTPLANETLHFEVRNEVGGRVYVGYLDEQQEVLSKTTDSSGNVSVTYTGPLWDEISDYADDFRVYIYAYLAWQGKETIQEWAPVIILKDNYNLDEELQFDLTADPNVLWCSNTRPQSTITGIFYFANGTPIVGRKVFFKILSGKGEFQDGKTTTYVITGEDGAASISYIGPTNTEMSTTEETVTIQGQPETWWVDPENDEWYIHKEMTLRLIKGSKSEGAK